MKSPGMNIDALSTFVKKLASLRGYHDSAPKDNDTPEEVAYRKGYTDALRALAAEAQAALDK
mgnify:CR=1 FL=1